MLGTAQEIFTYLSGLQSTHVKLGMTTMRVRTIRIRMNAGYVGEETLAGYLRTLGAREVRPAFILPALIRDKRGRMYNEITFMNIYLYDRRFKHLNLVRIYSNVAAGKMPNTDVIKEMVKTLKFSVIEPRYTVPSIWEYDTIDMY